MIGNQTHEDIESGTGSAMSDWRFRLLHSVELLDGKVLTGDRDCRGAEETLLGGEKFWGLRVLEVAPGSAWLSAYLAARCGDYTVLDRPVKTGGKADEVRAGWVHVMHVLGLLPTGVADPGHPSAGQPPGYDAVVSFGALSRAENPLELLGCIAELSDDTIVLIEPSETCDRDGSAGAHLIMTPETADLYGARWVFSPLLLERLLTQAGFERQRVTRHVSTDGLETEGAVTIVARRSSRRAPALRQPVSQVAETPVPSPPRSNHSPDLEAAEELPLPPPADRRAAIGTADVEMFVTVGRNVFEQMVQALARNGIVVGNVGRVLDFGCGLSRVLRWWRMFPAVEVHGTDIDVAAIMWNRERLGHGVFAFNTLDPKLDYLSDSFDLVHAIDVMTHLPEHLQIVWFKELLRILRPGGLLYFTSRGQSCRALLPPDLQAVFDNHRLVSGGAEQAGTEHCVAFHPPQWVVNTLIPAIGGEVVELVECQGVSPGEDRWLLRKYSSNMTK